MPTENFNHFTWCDLSTFDLARAQTFYSSVLGWTHHRLNSRGDDYSLCYAGAKQAAGLYTMPEFFQNIRMPSFWMSYIRVRSITESVALAVELGGKCEIEPTPLDDESQFALIRDPLGAGFSLYEGPELSGRSDTSEHGRMVWNELHVRSIDPVEHFYRELFGWSLDMYGHRWLFLPPKGDAVGALRDGRDRHGRNNYWAVTFKVRDLDTALESIIQHGGEVLARPSRWFGFAMATDDQGSMFCLSD